MSLTPSAAFVGPTVAQQPAPNTADYLVSWSTLVASTNSQTGPSAYTITASIYGGDIPDVLTRTVVPEATAAGPSFASGPGMEGGAAAAMTYLIIHPNDIYNNLQLRFDHSPLYGNPPSPTATKEDEFYVVIWDKATNPSIIEQGQVSIKLTDTYCTQNGGKCTCSGQPCIHNSWRYEFEFPSEAYQIFVYINQAGTSPNQGDPNVVDFNADGIAWNTALNPSLAFVLDSTWNDQAGYVAGETNSFTIQDVASEGDCDYDSDSEVFRSSCEISTECAGNVCAFNCLQVDNSVPGCSTANNHGIPPFVVTMFYLGVTGSDPPQNLGGQLGSVGSVQSLHTNGNAGQYLAEYVAKKAGLYSVTVAVRGMDIWYPQDTNVPTSVCHIMESDHCASWAGSGAAPGLYFSPGTKTDLKIVPAAVSDDISVITVQPAGSVYPVQAGEPYTIEVELKDEFGNVITDPSKNELSVTFTPEEDSKGIFERIPGRDGSYSLTFEAREAVPTNMRIFFTTLQDQFYQDRTLIVEPGPISAVGSIILRDETNVVAGALHSFQIWPKDRFSNPIIPSQSDSSNDFAIGGMNFASPPTKNKNGDHFVVTFTTEEAGQQQLTVKYGKTSPRDDVEPGIYEPQNSAAEKSPLNLEVFPGPMDPTKTTFQVNSPVPAATEQVVTFQVFDQFDNKRENCVLSSPCDLSDPIQFVLTHKDGSGTTITAVITKPDIPTDDGMWEATYEGTKAGDYDVVLRLWDGSQLTQADTTKVQTICFGDVDILSSSVTNLLPSATIPAGDTHFILITLRDKYGNLRIPGQCQLPAATGTQLTFAPWNTNKGDNLFVKPHITKPLCLVDSERNTTWVGAEAKNMTMKSSYLGQGASQEMRDLLNLATASGFPPTDSALVLDAANYMVTFHHTKVGTYSYDVQVEVGGVQTKTRECIRGFDVIPGPLAPEATTFWLLDGVTRIDTQTPAISGVVGQYYSFLMKFSDTYGNPLQVHNYKGVDGTLQPYEFMDLITLGQGADKISFGNSDFIGLHNNATTFRVDDNNKGWMVVTFRQEKVRAPPSSPWILDVLIDGVSVGKQPVILLLPDIIDRTRVDTQCDFGDANAPPIFVKNNKVRPYITCLAPATNLRLTAAMPAAYSLHARDQFDNTVTGVRHTYQQVARRIEDDVKFATGSPTLPAVIYYPLDDTTGNYSDRRLAYFTPIWHGSYDVSVVLWLGNELAYPEPNARADWLFSTGSGPIKDSPFVITVDHATCAFSDPTTPFRCPSTGEADDRFCVDSYDKCTAISVGDLEPEIPDSVLQNPGSYTGCPANSYPCDYVLMCVSNLAHCPPRPTVCPAFAPERCPGSGVCRADTASCPSPQVCAPGWSKCPDLVSCALDVADCDASLTAAPGVTPKNRKLCQDGSWVQQLGDCPSAKTCQVSTDVVCPDGSCQATKSQCPSLYDCFPPTEYRCPRGECRASQDQCPSQVVCPKGYTLCENDQCSSSVSSCPPYAGCAYNETRCPDASCKDNLLLCSTEITCPVNFVRCPDGSCKVAVALCSLPLPPTVPGKDKQCKDGSYVADLEDCPTTVSCPADYPALCHDGSCEASISDCPKTAPQCPPASPIGCPDRSCKAIVEQCGTSVTCPDSTPFKCPDGSCRADTNQCASPALLSCDSDEIRCPGGECSPSLSLCPDTSVCPTGRIKCADHSCRSSCDLVPQTMTICGRGAYEDVPVTCPDGISCRANLDDCPTGIVCPAGAPVKCIDASCRGSTDQCPEMKEIDAECNLPETGFTDFQAKCPDGTCVEADILVDGERPCGSEVTCHESERFRCYDSTCRQHPDDCPPIRECPQTGADAAPFLCSGGVCVTKRKNCVSNDYCEADIPVLCADGVCKATVEECAVTLDEIKCPDTKTLCPDGSCMKNDADCPFYQNYPQKCPISFPLLCENGMCGRNETECGSTITGCPAHLPVRCWHGACAASQNDCPASVNARPARPNSRRLLQTQLTQQTACDTGVLCEDGSCAVDIESCPFQNGCPKQCESLSAYGYLIAFDSAEQCSHRCWNGHCVQSAGEPNFECGQMPDCPYNLPVKCDNGLCVKTGSLCPDAAEANLDDYCNGALPFSCADGSCVSATILCPPVSPCLLTFEGESTGREFCTDGTCRLAGTCPVADASKCRDPRPYLCGSSGETNVYTGICVASADQCIALEPDNPIDAGCPIGQQSCNDAGSYGLCVTITNGTDLSTVCREQAVPANGCPRDTEFKCFNGECVANATLSCLNPDGCASGTKRCPDGSCLANAATCPVSTECAVPSDERCPDGSCAGSYIDCVATNGCPVSSPVRCSNGLCLQTLADCPPQAVCNSWEPYKCADGTCQALPSLCPKVSNCPLAAPYRCPITRACVLDDTACSASVEPTSCPPSTSRCRDGSCVKDVADCPDPASTCQLPAPMQCSDGACRNNAQDCYDKTTSLKTDPSFAADCPFICSDGSCVENVFFCGGVPACTDLTGLFRCQDGTCMENEPACVATGRQAVSCPAETAICPDGSCVDQFGPEREVLCAGLFGCYGETPYQCPDGVCGLVAEDCLRFVFLPEDAYKVCAASDPDWGTCVDHLTWFRYIPAESFTRQVTTAANEEFTLALYNGEAVLKIEARSGTITDNDAIAVGVRFEPVPRSNMVGVRNPVDETRVLEYGNRLDFDQTVLSVPFTCYSSNTTVLQDVTVQGQVDRDFPKAQLAPTLSQGPGSYVGTELKLIPKHDICLAFINSIGAWECTSNAFTGRTEVITVPKSAADGRRNTVQATLDTCGPEGTTYAFISKPIQIIVATETPYDWWAKWWWAVMIGCIAGAIFIGLVGFALIRLLRYRKKYKTERTAKEDAQAELDEIAENDELGLGHYGQAGAGTHVMVNPLGPAGQMQGSDNAEILAEKQAMKEELERQRHETRLANQDVEMAGGDFDATTMEFGQEQHLQKRDV